MQEFLNRLIRKQVSLPAGTVSDNVGRATKPATSGRKTQSTFRIFLGDI